jgi:5'-deoxynucleotidase YfbR-like HD superfamily hydrolase
MQMTEQEVIDKVCDRLVTTLYNELDYYMFEFLGYTETDERYVKDADKLARKIIKEIIE